MANLVTQNQMRGVPVVGNKAPQNDPLYDELLRIICELVKNEKFDYECDFRDALYEELNKTYHGCMEVETISLTDDDHSKWRIDIVVLFSGQYIPIELKYRHNDQSINGYGKDFADDVQRINELIDKYDDIQTGYAICLTDNNDLVDDCKDKIAEYDQSNDGKQHCNNYIIWNDADRGYHIGFVGRYETQDRWMLPNKNSFKEFWINKKYK